MKKIVCLILLIQSGFMMAQKETVATINGKKVQVNTKINNGLSDTANGEIQLGGALLKPSTITTTSANTLSIGGLQTGTNADNVLVADANGVLKWVTRASFVTPGDNLGNHIATQDLTMSGKNIAGAANVTAAGIITGANITATTKTTTPAAQITTGAGLGKVAVSDATGNVTWTDASTITAKGDNLGNHIATQNLDMSNKNINNINTASIYWQLKLNDVTTSNTKYTGLWKKDGVFGIWNEASGKNDLAIDETSGKTTLTGAAISKGTDGVAPAAGYVATSADANGNVVWKSAASIGAGDNLGNHTATQDLAMSGKNIANAANVTATGTVNGANITATTKTTTPAAQITTGAGLGKVAVSDASGNLTWTDASTIAAKGDNLGNHTATQDLAMSGKNIAGAANVTATGTVTGGNITATTKTTTPAAQITTGAGAGKVAVSDASGNLTWTDASTIAAKGDNLGNHTATQNLDMAAKNINNINNAYIKNEIELSDRTTSNTNYFGLDKYNGNFQIFNSSKTAVDLSINEGTRKTTVNNLAINAGTDGAAPVAGYIATSADANGNVVWKSAASIGAGDNLGNHTATQDLAMSGKNIAGAANVTATGTITGANITATTKTTTPAAQITTGAGLGKVAVSDASGNLTWTDASTIAAKGDNLGNHTATQDLAMSGKNIAGAANVTATGTITGANITATTKTTTPAAQITTGAGAGKVAVSDASGNLTWTDASTIAAKGDDLGNHTATQDLAMSGKNILGAANVTGTGTITGANITATTKTTTPAAQITTGAGAGKVAVSDATGNVTWTDPSTIAAKGDDLGNHIATQALNMSSKDINKINTASVDYQLKINDVTTTNTKYTSLWKKDGVFGIWNQVTGKNDLAIDETSGKTTLTGAAISKGTDGVAPAAGYIATSADANGNVVWKSAASIGAGDNLGNHTATQDLAMSGKNIAGAANVTATGTITGANITATTKTTTPAAQITTGAGAGKLAVSDASGNLTWTDASTIAAKGDNLGNHTATQDLAMSGKNIAGAANVTATGTVTGANITATTKTTTPAAQITTGAGLGKVAVSDATGNITWTDASTIAAKGDDLGNHTATQDLAMSGKNIAGAANVTATGIVTGGNITATTKTTTPAAQITTGAGAGKLAVSDASGNLTWTDPATITVKGDDLGNHTATQALNMSSKDINKINTASVDYQLKINDVTTTNTKYVSLWKKDGLFGIWGQGTGKNDLTITEAGNVGIGLNLGGATNALHVKATADPLRIEGLAASSLGTESALIVGSDGVVKKTPQPLPRRSVYYTGAIAPGESKTVTLDFSSESSTFTITSGNGCGRTAIASLVTSYNVIAFVGGQARDILYKATVLDANGTSLNIKSVSAVTTCTGDGGPTQFDFDIQKTSTSIIITNRGDANRGYTIKQNEL